MAFQAQGRIWPYRVAILLLPLIVLWHQDNSLFTPPGQIDTWVYFGYFRNLVNFKRDLFPNLYYGTRLSLILPGWLLHSVLSPMAASTVFHLGMLWVASLSLFQTLRLTVGARTAFLTTLVFSTNPQVCYAVGWDYFDGIGIAYCLLALALFTGAAATPGRVWPLIAAGGLIAGLVYSNLLWTALAPLTVAHYVALAWMWHRPRVKTLIVDVCLWCGAGFLIVTAAFCAINYAMDGSLWFYGPSLHIVPHITHATQPSTNPWTSHGLMSWLWFTAVAAIAAVTQFAIRPRRPAPLLFSAQLLAALAVYGYLQPRTFSVFGMPFYAALLLPFDFLVIGCAFWPAVETLSHRAYVSICCVAALLFGVVWYDFAAHWTPLWPDAVPLVATLGTVMLAAGYVFRHRTAGMLLAIAGFALFSAEVRYIPKIQLAGATRTDGSETAHAHRSTLQRIVEIRAAIETERHDHAVHFWYDDQEPAVDDYRSVNASYLYQYTLWPKPFPQFTCDAPLQPDTLVVVSSMRERVAEVARNAISECAARTALQVRVASNRLVQHPKGEYTTAILALEPDPSRWHRVRVENGALVLTAYAPQPIAFPPEHWTPLYVDLHTQLHFGPEGVEVQTPSVAHAGAAAYGPFAVPESGRYRFAMRYRLHSGEFAFGVTIGGKWLAVDVAGRLQRECWVDLKAGQEIRIEVVNNNSQGDIPASLLIQQVSVTGYTTSKLLR